MANWPRKVRKDMEVGMIRGFVVVVRPTRPISESLRLRHAVQLESPRSRTILGVLCHNFGKRRHQPRASLPARDELNAPPDEHVEPFAEERGLNWKIETSGKDSSE